MISFHWFTRGVNHLSLIGHRADPKLIANQGNISEKSTLISVSQIRGTPARGRLVHHAAIPRLVPGTAAITTALSTGIFTPGKQRRLLPTHANGSPAFGLSQRESEADAYQLLDLMVLGLEGEQIASLIAFLEPFLLSSFALPPPLT